MLGVARRNEYLTLILGIFGCLAFLLVVTSRRDELANLRDDFQDRMSRTPAGAQSGQADLGSDPADRAMHQHDIGVRARRGRGYGLGCEQVQIECLPPGSPPSSSAWDGPSLDEELLSRPSAIFRLSGGRGPWIALNLGLGADAPLSADIVFRYMHRLGQALDERLERLREVETGNFGSESRAVIEIERSDRRAEAEPRATVEALSSRNPGWVGPILGFLGGRGLVGLATRRPAVDPLTGPHSPARR